MTTEPRDSHALEDDGFHEIQLSGKQLVFLCMATTVVSIVIFLCGVLVGRGVRPVEPVAEAAAVTSTEPTPAAEPPAPAPSESAVTPAVSRAPASSVPAANASAANKPAAAESMPTPTPDAPPTDAPSTDGRGSAAAKPGVGVAANRSVASPSSPPATTTPAPVKPAEPAPTRPEPPKTEVAASRPAPAASQPVADGSKPEESAKPATPAATTSSGSGAIAVQVGAMKEKSDAEALARHLSGKGYAVYIVQPAGNAPNPVYRVRVGNYTSADEAGRVKRRLEQEEKLKPWITR